MRSASPGQWTCPMAFTPHRRYHQQNWNFWDQPGPQRTTLPNSGPANHHKKIASTDSDSLESHFMWYIQTLAFSYGFYCVFCVPTFIAPHIREPALMAANQWGTHGHQGLCSRAFSKKWLCNISLFGPSKYRPTQIANPQKDYKSTKNLAKKTEDKICGNHKTTTATSKHIKKHQNLFWGKLTCENDCRIATETVKKQRTNWYVWFQLTRGAKRHVPRRGPEWKSGRRERKRLEGVAGQVAMQVPGCLTSLDPTTPPREGRNLGMAGHYHESSPNHLMHILVGFGEVSGHRDGWPSKVGRGVESYHCHTTQTALQYLSYIVTCSPPHLGFYKPHH